MKKTAYVNGWILDGTPGMLPRDCALLLNGEKIEEVVPQDAVPADVEKVDLYGAFVVPGLINLETRLTKAEQNIRFEENRARIAENLEKSPTGQLLPKTVAFWAAIDEIHGGCTTVCASQDDPAECLNLAQNETLTRNFIFPEILPPQDKSAAAYSCISPDIPGVFFVEERGIRAAAAEQRKAEFVKRIARGRKKMEKGEPIALANRAGSPYISHFDFWRELVYFARWIGVENLKVLEMATRGNAEISGIDGRTGTLEPGKDADFLVLRGNPVTSLTALKHPDRVVAKGRVIRHPQYNVLTKNEELFDKTMRELLPADIRCEI